MTLSTLSRPVLLVPVLMLCVDISACDSSAKQHVDTAATTSSAVTPVTVTPSPAAPSTASVTPDAPVAPAKAAVSAAPSRLTPQAAPRRPVSVLDADLTTIGYDRGQTSAAVVVVDFSDFGCPYCGEFERETFPTIDRDYIKTGKVFFKYVPFVAGMFPNSTQATRAAECAADQGQFWTMHDRLYASQAEWKKNLAPFQLFQRDAADMHLDPDRFSACYVGQKTDQRTDRATSMANRIGVRVTPSFVVNGHAIEGALPLADFRKVLDDAVAASSRKP